ncbi:hypothetical protein ACQEVZ_55435 [Dactylosporangium sp. CA-152071]|uniref:hypothetical protein n=1 Tax=Dactylosporangium sp. CA-152071 TaxID=3239933 RepID=UPI003D938F60
MANSRRSRNARHVVEVNEVLVFATRRGSDWWVWFLIAHRNTGRITDVAVSLGGAICHVACDSREDAQWLATAMVEEHGLPKAAVKARSLQDRQAPAPSAAKPEDR